MRFEENKLYHVYNRSFNKYPVFLKPRNYPFFLNKLGDLKIFCGILAYCLMPNHFHLMINVPEKSEGLNPTTINNPNSPQVLTRKIGTILSSYTQAINKQENKTGSLFQPKTKAIELEDSHAFACFHYIHQNPLKAKLVSRLEDWPHSSFNEYFQSSPGLCNKELAFDLLDIPMSQKEFYAQSYSVFEDKVASV